jgi:alanine or glycine:cation symporter, AGCS family
LQGYLPSSTFTVMIASFFNLLSIIDNFYWSYIGFFLLILVGAHLTYRSHFYQIRAFIHIREIFSHLLKKTKKEMPGVSPIRLIFASAGGMVGLGNIIAIVTALVVGGPGSLFWLWICALMGIIIKYAETYIGLKYRTVHSNGKGYNGGPMYYIPYAFKGRLGQILASTSAFLLCIYGVEIFQFNVVAESLAHISTIPKEIVILLLLSFTIYVGLGGVGRLANVCSLLMPIFILGYATICLWIIGLNIEKLPEIFAQIFRSAFTGMASTGGFAGASVLMAMQQGAARAVYSADIAIGFDSIVQSESREVCPVQQARTAMISTLIDIMTCTFTLLVLQVTDVWKMNIGPLENIQYVTLALQQYFPESIEYLLTATIFIVGCATVQAYFVVGMKAASFLSSRYGKKIYIFYAILAFWTFAHYDASKVMLIMSLSGGLLIFINLISLLKLRKVISYKSLRDAT